MFKHCLQHLQRHRLNLASILLSISTVCVGLTAQTSFANEPAAIKKQHGLSIYGDLKYSADFKHFNYVNPKAPKGGTLKQASLGSFDSLNPFIIKGVPAAGIGLIYDTLLEQSADEAFSEYGLLAESVQLSADGKGIIFNLRTEAKFHDGKPVTAEDVKFTFETLMAEGRPFYRAYYADIEQINVLSAQQVQFRFKTDQNRELPLIIGQVPILPKHYWATQAFDKTTLTPPIGSGPYSIGKIDNGRSITYQRNHDYWGKDLAINVGRHNFDQIIYEYYRDSTVALEAFKAGNLNFRQENSSKFWATAYDSPALTDGSMVKAEIQHQNPTGMQAFAFNLRREPFQNKAVREALNLAFDFEWTNKNLFYGAYTRTSSYFSNSELASSGLPSDAEKALLMPFKDQIAPTVLTQPFVLNKTKGDGNIRTELREAARLLNSAGWVVKNGKRVDQNGKPIEIEMLLYDSSFERIVHPFKKNLERLGITLNIRVVDTSQYINRVRNFDFDMIVHSIGQSNSPGNEQREFWHSEYANKPDSSNIMGIQNTVVDALVEQIIVAKDRQSLINLCRALDRVLLSEHYLIPHWGITQYRVAYRKEIQRPAQNPPYSLATDTWWYQGN